MLRELIRTIVSAFKMFTRMYWRYLVFAALFMFFFRLLGYLMGALLILPVSPLFEQWEFNFSNPGDVTNIWWLERILRSGGTAIIFAVGMLGAYISRNPQRVSFADFLRGIPGRAWRLFLLLFVISNLLHYSIDFSWLNKDVQGWKWMYYFLDWAPKLIVYMGGALVYMRAAGIAWERKYWRKLIIYQIADLAITFGMMIITAFFEGVIMGLTVNPEPGTWSYFLATAGLSFIELVFTILFYGCLVHAVFHEEKENFDLELDSSASGLLVVKN